MKSLSLIFILGMFSGCYSSEPEKTGLEGKPLPSFTILLSDSLTSLNTKNIPSGNPIVFFYYGPHCPYSRAQMEEMIEYMSLMKKIRFYLITNVPYSEMMKFYRHFELNKFPNVTAGVDYKNFFGDYFKITGVPFTAIYNSDKKLDKAFAGKIYTKQIINEVFN